MNRSSSYVVTLLLVSCLFYTSCQKDSFTEPEVTPKVYSFSIPNKISFDFSQQSKNSKSIIPYSNSLSLKNISETSISGDFTVFAFKSSDNNYNNLAFIEEGNFTDLAINDSLSITLQQSDALFTNDNLIASVLNFDDPISDHDFNGLYNGELNVHSIDDDFLRSITCIGIIDYQGKFNFFIQDGEEDNIVRLKGNFNSDRLISGEILKKDGTSLSQILNIADATLKLESNALTGSVLFTESSEERILKFNLTRQN